MVKISRRKLLGKTGASMIAAAGIAGCLGGGGDVTEELTVAYVPIFPNMQHYVMDEQGLYKEMSPTVSIERFSDGPSVVTAVASGDVDAALFGISPSMVLVDRGTDASVLAANSRNGFKVMATEEVADQYEQTGGFAQFEADKGRQVRFGIPPEGSVPEVVLRYWIEEDLQLGNRESAINTSTIPPARATQTIQSGDIDATMIQEPFATIIGEEDGVREIEWSGNILEGHPVTVLFARQDVIDEPDIAEPLVEKHIEATESITESPDQAAANAAEVIGEGVSEQRAREALESRASDFLSDPHTIAEQTEPMADLVADAGNTEEVVDTDELFNFDVYDAV